MSNGRLVRIALWLLAVILPGGLVLLALWASVRAVRARSQAGAVRSPMPTAAAGIART